MRCDCKDESSMEKLMRGIDTLFINVPSEQNRVKLATCAIDAAKRFGVKHVIIISTMQADMTNEIFGKMFNEIESHLKKSGLPFTILRCANFYENQLHSVKNIKEKNMITCPVKADNKFVGIAVDDIGEAIAVVMSNASKHAGKTYCLTAKPYSHNDLCNAFSTALGKKINFQQMSFSDAKKDYMSHGWEEWQADGVLEVLKDMETQSESITKTSADFRDLTGHEAMPVDQWVKQVAVTRCN